MEKQPVIIPEQIHLFRMDVMDDRIDNKGFTESKENNLGVAHKVMHNLKDERVKIELYLSFNDENSKELAYFHVDFHYQIESLSNFYDTKENGKPIFFAPLIATLLGIGLSTSRGIVSERLGNKGIKDIILPVVSPMKMLKD